MKSFRPVTLLALAAICTSSAWARLGETEGELVARFGKESLRSNHSIVTQGKSHTLGPVLFFKQDDWSINCYLIDNKCMRISYAKPGDWSEDQIRLVLNSNSQGAQWGETSKPSIAKLQRTWKRIDGSTASWQKGGGMTLVWDAYNKAKAAVEERAKVAAKKKPKI